MGPSETAESSVPEKPLNCPRCTYDLSGNPSPACPECGAHVRREFQRRGEPKSVASILVPVLLGAVGRGCCSYALLKSDGSIASAAPLAIAVHSATVSTTVMTAGTVLLRDQIRRARRGIYDAYRAFCIIQLIPIAFFWLLVLCTW